MPRWPKRPALAAGAAALVASAFSPPPIRPATQYVVGIDISASRTPVQLQEGRRLVVDLMTRLQPGDRVVLVETYQRGSGRARQWEDSLPLPKTPGRLTGGERQDLEDFRSSAPSAAAGFFNERRSKTIRTTDIFSTLFRAADYARKAHGRRTVLLLVSDMLNSTPDLDMERSGGVPGAGWVAARKAEQRLPDLRGVCVAVSGADVASRRGAQVREFWRQYFTAAGASFSADRYRALITDAGDVGCE